MAYANSPHGLPMVAVGPTPRRPTGSRGQGPRVKGRAGTPVPGPNSSAPSGDGPVTRHRDQIAHPTLRAESGKARTRKDTPPSDGGAREPCEAQRTPLRRTPACQLTTGWSGEPVSDPDVTLGFLTHVEQPGCLREGASRVPALAPIPGDVSRAAGPVGHRAPAGGYRAG